MRLSVCVLEAQGVLLIPTTITVHSERHSLSPTHTEATGSGSHANVFLVCSQPALAPTTLPEQAKPDQPRPELCRQSAGV